ncbi:MAG: hypothetical protein LC620_00390 [Halobacteriales archaeon]|nr:hypothetical protein [Halobacteriales archaeon]
MTEWPTRPPVGTGLLSASLAEDRESILVMVGAAYRNLLDEKRRNFGLWHAAMDTVATTVRQKYAGMGLTAAPFQLLALWARVGLLSPSSDPNAHMRLITALMTPFDQELADHVLYRMRTGGNVHLEFSGPTGMGKSSCAVALADWIKPIPQLTQHLSFDLNDLPRKLRGKTPGQTVIQDEFLATAGEGSRTIQQLFTNVEDTLRASQVNLFTVSPTRKDHNTTQAELELILWNPERKFSCFLVWLQGTPHGVVALPWMPNHLWQAYKPWKAANVERTLGGQFKDNEHTAKTVVQLFEDERFVEYLWLGVNKPKMGDFNTAIVLFHGGMLAQVQVERMAKFAYEQCYAYERIRDRFEWFFGVKPNAGFEKIAAKCYEE